jgi:dTDP-4-dehydrorhamnose 3,5-epimerase
VQVRSLGIYGLFEIVSDSRDDERGSFVRLYDRDLFKKYGVCLNRVQDSYIYTDKIHTLRGLHISLPPHLEGKSITGIKGETLWVSVDVRKDSETFGEWRSIILSGSLKNSLYAARGFAHGCVSFNNGTELLTSADNTFSEAHGVRVHWDDPRLAIDWQLSGAKPIVRTEYPKPIISFAEFVKQYGGVEV